MVSAVFDASGMLRWRKDLVASKRSIARGCADTLNQIGDNLAERITEVLAAELGVPPGVFRGTIYVSRATASDLTYKLNSTPAWGGEAPKWEGGARTWRDVARPMEQFKRGELVWAVNPHEDRCEICDDIIKKKLVYTIEEAYKEMSTHSEESGGGTATNWFHKNCRCRPVPARTIGRLPGKFSVHSTKLHDLTVQTVEEYMKSVHAIYGLEGLEIKTG